MHGYTALEAAHGVEALAVLRGIGGADLILLDWRMPVMNGLAFYLAFRDNPAFRDIPIVVVSGESAVHDHARLIGAAGGLLKPVPPALLLDTVRTVLGRNASPPPNVEPI